MDNIDLSLLFILISVLVFMKVSYFNLELDTNKYTSLFLFLVSSIALWGGIVYIGKDQELKRNDYIGLFFSVLIGILTWLRLIYTI
jgi:hypothetical protein